MTDLTVREAGAELHASPQTVRALIKSHDLAAYRLRGNSGPWRIRPEAVEKYKQQQEALRSDPWVRTRPRPRNSAA